MMRCKLFLLACSLILITAGCGYRIGVRGMVHPQLKSVAIAPVRNNTVEPLVSDVLRMQLAGEIQRDGALKLKRLSNADCVIYMVVTSVKNSVDENASFDGGKNFTPAKYILNIVVQFKVVIPGSGTVVSSGTVNGGALYEVLADPATAKASALKFACFHAAEKIVEQITEAW